MNKTLWLAAVGILGLGVLAYSGGLATVPVLGPFLVETGISPRPDGVRLETYYQYTDDQGRVRFAKDLDEVPAEWRERAGRIRMAGPPPTRPGQVRSRMRGPASSTEPPASGTPASASGSRPGALAPARSGEIILYTKDACAVCQRAVAHLTQRGVPFVERNIDHDSQAKSEYHSKVGFGGGIPVFDLGGELVKGYDATRLNAALDRYTAS